MSSKAPGESMPPEAPGPAGEETPRPPGARIPARRLALAFAIAALADGLSVAFTMAPPLEWTVDAVTVLLLFVVLGWQWILLPGLILEAIPGVCVLPFWVLVVGAVAVWGTARPQLNGNPLLQKRR